MPRTKPALITGCIAGCLGAISISIAGLTISPFLLMLLGFIALCFGSSEVGNLVTGEIPVRNYLWAALGFFGGWFLSNLTSWKELSWSVAAWGWAIHICYSAYRRWPATPESPQGEFSP